MDPPESNYLTKLLGFVTKNRINRLVCGLEKVDFRNL